MCWRGAQELHGFVGDEGRPRSSLHIFTPHCGECKPTRPNVGRRQRFPDQSTLPGGGADQPQTNGESVMTDFSKERRYINGSLLPAASTPVSAGELISWVAELAEKILGRRHVVSANAGWAYRHYGQHLSVDILDAGGKYYTLTFKNSARNLVRRRRAGGAGHGGSFAYRRFAERPPQTSCDDWSRAA